MPPCHKPRRDRLDGRLPEHEHGGSMRRGRPVSRGAAVVAGTTLLILRPMKHTAALRPAARPANPPADPFRSQYCNSGRRRGGVALASYPAATEMTATAVGGGGTTTHIGSIKDCASGRRGAGPTRSVTETLASRVSFGVQGGGLQKHTWRAAGRRPVAPLRMSQTSPPVFQPQQAGDRKDGSSSSPTAAAAAGDSVLGQEDDHLSSNGQGPADVRQQPVVSLHQHRRHNHHPVPVVDVHGSASPLNGHHHTAGAAAAAVASSAVSAEPAPPPRVADDIAAMKALGKEGRWREAVAVLSRLKEDAAAASNGDGSDLAPNLAVYNAAISAVSRSGKWDEALGLLEEMRSAGVQPDVRTFTSVVSAGSRSGRVDLAEQVLDTMRAEGVPPNAATYNAVITGCSCGPPPPRGGGGGGGEVQRALRLLGDMAADPRPEAQPEALSYTLVLKACGREGRWETALQLLTEMQAKGLEPTVLSFRHALTACTSSSSSSSSSSRGVPGGSGEEDFAAAWERCRSLMDAMGMLGLEPDRLCYKQAVDAAAKAGDVDAALDLMDGMETCEGFRGAVEYNQIIMACGRAGEWQRAVSTLGRIRRAGAAPDAHSFAMAMTACARAGESRQALRLLDELKREGGRVRPNTVVYNTLLALCRGKPLRGVRGGGVGGGGGGVPAAATAAAEGTGPNLNGYGSGGGLEEVNGHGVTVGMPGGRAIRNGVSVPGGGTVGSGTGVSSPLGGTWGERPDELVGTAVALLHEMTVGGSECAPDKMSFELVMQACVNAGKPDSALKVFRAMTRFAAGEGDAAAGGGGGGSGERWGGGRGRAVRVRPDRATFRLGLTAAAEAGDGPAAAVLLEEMRDAGIAMDESAFHLAATAFGRAGLWRQGVRVAVVAAEQGIALAPSTLTSILGACAKQARWREALGLLQDTRSVLQQAFSSPLLTGAGLVAGAAERRGQGNAVAAYTLAMVACRGGGRHAEGLRVLEMLEEDGGLGDEAFFRVALKCCAKAGGVGGRGEGSGAAVADRVLEGMSAQGIRCGVEGFTDIAQAYGIAGRWEDALALLPRAAALAADEQEGGNPRAAVPDERMYCSVINAMGESGAWEAAVELIQSMRRRPSAAAAAATGGSGSGTSDSGASGVAAAAVVSSSLEAPPPGRAAYGCACRACARKGEWSAVLGLMEDMREDGLERDSAVYASAMRAFVEAGDWERAVEIVTVEMERDGVSPDALSYSQAFRACRAGADGSGRAAQLALALVGEIRSRGLEPGVVILESAARACLADGRPELALDIVSEALHSWRRGSLGGHGDGGGGGGKRWAVDEVQRLETMRIMLLGRLGRWEDSLEALDAMRAKFGDDDLDERAFVSAAYACAAAGEWSMIQVLQAEASAVGDGDGVSPGSAWEMQRALLSGLTTAGMWRRAMGMLREMHHGGGDGTVTLAGEHRDQAPGAGGEGGLGMPDPSPHWQRRMFKDHRSVMHACLRAGAWDKALSVWSDLRSIVEGPIPCGRTYTAALRACGPLGLWATARDLLAEMRDGANGGEGGGQLLPETRHYAFAVSAATVADDISSDEEAALSGRGGWGAGGSDAAVVGGDVRSDNAALRSVLSDMAAAAAAAAAGSGVEIGWETYASVCWARSQRKQWHRASLGVLELMGEHGFGDGAPGTEEAAEGMRSLYGRLLAAASKIPSFATNAGGTRSAAPARNAVRQVFVDAEERLASAPGGTGPRVLAAAATAFARAGDWEGARDVAVRFDPRLGGPAAAGASVGTEEPSAVRRRAADAAAAAVSVAVAATARAGELAEAEALAELARVVATTAELSASRSGGGGGGATRDGSRSRGPDGEEEARVSCGNGRSNNPLGLDHSAGVALADAYERAGRLSDAEGLRSRLQGQIASCLGLEEAAAVPRLPSVGGHSRRRHLPPGEDESTWPPDEEAGGDDEQYDLFLQWMATGEEEDEDEDEGDTWLSDDDEIDDDGLVAGPPDESDEEGLTIRELEGW